MQHIVKSFCILFLLVVGCASVSSTQVRGPDGHWNWYTIHCRHDMDCLAEAGTVCTRGYQVMDQNSEKGFVAFANKSNVFASSTNYHDIMVRCHTKDE